MYSNFINFIENPNNFVLTCLAVLSVIVKIWRDNNTQSCEVFVLKYHEVKIYSPKSISIHFIQKSRVKYHEFSNGYDQYQKTYSKNLVLWHLKSELLTVSKNICCWNCLHQKLSIIIFVVIVIGFSISLKYENQ